MDSYEKIVVTDDIQKIVDDLTICLGSADDLKELTSYIELTRHLQEIYQWYRIFNYNYDMIKELYPDGNLDAINSHTISLISAGKNIVSSAELCILNSFSDGTEKKTEFINNYSSKIYDDSFSYRFLTRLRDFTQHLHIPVSRKEDGIPCFDMSKILDTPHFDFNKAIQRESQNLIDDVAKKTGNNLTLSYRDTVCAYCCSLYKLFKAFLDIIQPALYAKFNDCKEAVSETPEAIHHDNHPELDGWLFYQVDEQSEVHCFDTITDPTKELIQYLNDCNSRYKSETKDLKELRKHMIPIE